MTSRPYLTSSIQDLEALFENNDHDHRVLEPLLDELNHRTTSRARRLKDLVAARLRKLNATHSSGSHAEVMPVAGAKPEPSKTVEAARSPRTDIGAELDDGFWQQPVPCTEASCELPDEPINDERVNAESKPHDILDAWIAMEVLSPQSFNRPEDLTDGDRRRIAKLDGNLPWSGAGEKSRPNHKLYYHVILGAVRLDLATRDLLVAFGDRRPEPPRPNGMAALGIITVDQKGRPAGDDPIAVSSFGYGYKKACDGDFDALREWPRVEYGIKEKLTSFFLRHDQESGELLPIRKGQIERAAQWLASGFALPATHFVKPAFVLRKYHWHLAPNPPEPPLLNSFYLEDLVTVQRQVDSGRTGLGLRRYLGIMKPATQTDLIEDRAALEEALAPKHVPLARWPATHGHSLVVLQQAAVNIAFRELKSEGILGVNGPPGTGKTTLLRDLVAGVVADRAEVLCSFDDPVTAFRHFDQPRFGRSYVHICSIADELKGHEIVVASANNKAVENISREIPELGHINRDIAPDYFRSVSDNIAGENVETWGLAAAVLGNSTNRWSFYRDFWNDDKFGFHHYLKACQGQDTDIVTSDAETGQEIRTPRPIVDIERPPSGRAQALERWSAERDRYRAVVTDVREKLGRLESLRGRIQEINLLDREISRLAKEVSNVLHAVSSRKNSLSECTAVLKASHKNSVNAAVDLENHKKARPNMLARLFFTKSSRVWRAKNRQLGKQYNDRLAAQTRQQAIVASEQQILKQLQAKLDVAKAAHNHKLAEAQGVRAELANAREVLGARLAGESFWSADHDTFQQSVAWLDDETQAARDRCFAAALDLHRAFIGAAAKPVRNNLRSLLSAILGTGLDSDKRKLLPDLWSTLSLVVPVVSTTFASVNRMLGALPPESIGWLLIDEAGQASPQMAAGAISRARRSLVVGDPLQIEPVVTLSKSLVSRIARRFEVDHSTWTAPWSSVQSLADTASDFAASIEQPDRLIRVGAPLLVHRRCEQPMFGISNAISYGGLMVQATQPAASPIRDVLGRSRWHHVVGPSEHHWCPDEGEVVMEMLRSMVRAGLEEPDIFIISPFRAVCGSLRHLVAQDQALMDALSPGSRSWLYDRIGTVHTFQGKQAEAVILVLGAQGGQHSFARQWATRPSNLINVAVSRAKRAFYVVGNRHLWGNSGCLSAVTPRLS